jgi:hypothetical protein
MAVFGGSLNRKWIQKKSVSGYVSGYGVTGPCFTSSALVGGYHD